ncbi:MAG: RluA family pseudouridine synthase [Alphaproteobacteria bacterium]|nr:RluA family pseudouridine synthase [Alphaproteobacteria bacterium]
MAEFLTISQVEDGTRLLRWFLRNYPGMLQRDFYKLCRGGQIRINSSRCKGTEILKAGDMVRIPPTLQSFKKVNKTETGERFSLADLEQLRKCIIYNDDDIVVFNKPAGLAVQGGTGIKKSIDKMAAALFPYDKVSLVHRLDKETSGLLIVAKNQRAAQDLASQFQNKTAHKEYLALLNGTITDKSGIIDNYVVKGQVFEDKTQIPKGVQSQRAVTEYKVLGEAAGLLTWILFSPKTGRTHQLRLHSAYSLKAPIFGDDLYGRGNNDIDENLKSFLNTQKLFLFAFRITFKHPGTHKVITLRANVPEFMLPVLNLLELQIP